MRSWVENPAAIRQCVAVKFKLPLLLLAAALIAGCDQSNAPQPKPATLEDLLPKQAQPKLRTIKLYLGAEVLEAELALSPQEIMTGMMFRTNIQETDAMLFLLPYPQRASFWMKNCPESLSAAYITTDGVIAEIRRLEANNTNSVLAGTDNIRFVLETKEGWFARRNLGPGTVIRTEKGSLAETFLTNQR
jgi:hypothetical protein